MFPEQVLEEATSIIQAAAAVVLRLSRARSSVLDVSVPLVGRMLMVWLLGDGCQYFLHDVMVLDINADRWHLLLVNLFDHCSFLCE